MKVLFKAILILSATAVAAPAVFADTVKIPVGQQGAGLKDIKMPPRGMTKEQVQQEFGAPMSKSDPVGDPPISSWEYKNYAVYFEKDLVLDTVLKFQNGGSSGK